MTAYRDLAPCFGVNSIVREFWGPFYLKESVGGMGTCTESFGMDDGHSPKSFIYLGGQVTRHK